MPSLPEDTVACSCPACGNLFAVKTSFLGQQVKCPICGNPVTAAQDDEKRDKEEECLPCRCNICSNPFAVKLSCLGCQVRCPVCNSIVTATWDVKLPETVSEATRETGTTPSGPEKEEEKRSRPPVSEYLPSPQKKVDIRDLPRFAETPHAPERNTTKIRKRRERKEEAPAIATAGTSALAEELPEYNPPSGGTAGEERKTTWPVWLFVSGLVLAVLGVFMFLRGNDLEAEGGKILDISEKFVDHEADFSTEADDAMMQALRDKAEQYQTAFLHRREEDREAESVARHITAAMNELALYCMAGSDEERLNHVISPAATRPKMAHWAQYARYKDYLPHEPGKSSKDGDLLQIPVLMDDNTMRAAVFLYDHDSKKWRLDWEAWEGYSPLFPAELKKKRPSSPVPVRVTISMSSHYAAPFLEESAPESYRHTAYIAFTLEFPNGERLNAYVDRYSPLALELTKLLYNGAVRACVSIHYPADLPGSQSVIIDRLEFPGWMSETTRKLLPKNN